MCGLRGAVVACLATTSALAPGQGVGRRALVGGALSAPTWAVQSAVAVPPMPANVRCNSFGCVEVQGVAPPAVTEASSRRAIKVAEALKQTRLYRHADRQARSLSFGEQQRLAIARAWALKPDVLFLDEPTASLDPAVTQSIEELINLINDAGTKIVMSTHDLGQARRLADEILFLHRGRLIAHAPAGDILNDPKPEEVRAFIDGDLYW